MDRGLLQRMVGALVLIALAVIFVPMLFNRQDELRHVTVDAPVMPPVPVVAEIEMEAVEVAEPAAPETGESFEIIEGESAGEAPPPAVAAVPEPVRPIEALQPSASATAPAPAAEPRLDANNLPVSWSIQLASLSNRASAENLQKTLRAQGYNAYIRTADGMNRVFVGPLVERSEANRLRDQLERQQKLNGFVVRFKPEGS